jgi:hypothetical protein
MHGDRLVTAAYVAAILGCAEPRARELVAAKRVPCCVIGKTAVYSAKEIGRRL